MPSVEHPTIDDVLLIHRRIIEETGGSHGVRSMDLLESAVNRPHAGFGDEEFYPDLMSKIAALFESIILNHPFVDGNKRTASRRRKRSRRGCVRTPHCRIHSICFNPTNDESKSNEHGKSN